jgi:hypothetical protein
MMKNVLKLSCGLHKIQAEKSGLSRWASECRSCGARAVLVNNKAARSALARRTAGFTTIQGTDYGMYVACCCAVLPLLSMVVMAQV